MIKSSHNPNSCSPNQKPIMECTLLDYGMLEAAPHLFPETSGFWRYAVAYDAVFKNFKDESGNPITVTAEDLKSGFVEIWVTDGISKKVILYSGVKDIIYNNVGSIVGEPKLHLFIDSSEGDTIAADNMQTTLTASVERYFKDFTNQVVSWQWFRESGDTQEDRDSDAMWAIDKTNRIIHLTNEDFTANIYNRSVTFTCQAIVNNELIEAKTTIG